MSKRQRCSVRVLYAGLLALLLGISGRSAWAQTPEPTPGPEPAPQAPAGEPEAPRAPDAPSPPPSEAAPTQPSEAAPAPAPAAPAEASAPAPASPATESTGAPDPEPPVLESVEPASVANATENAAPTELVVTGSRLRDAAGKQSPVLKLTREDLERTGLVSVGDILQRLPASGGAVNGKFNSSGNFGAPPDGGGIGAGAIEADLRYLGSKRVLVLVDGMRWVNGSSASGVAAATDLNTIPLGMIERIEVLEDGASPIYGSDAIAGVINIITRKRFDGAEANAYVGAYHPRDGLTQKYDLTFGTSSPRLSIVVGASYLDQRQISSADRAISNSPIPTLDKCEAGCSSATPQGRAVFVDPLTGESMNLALNNGVGSPRYPDDYHGFTPRDAFNYSPYNLLLTPSRRLSTFSSVIYHFTDSLNLHAKAAYTYRESLNQAAPEPLFIGPEGAQGTRVDRIAIDRTNPYNPFGFSFDPATNPYVVTRRPIEAGPRRFEQAVNTVQLSAGFDGTFKLGEQPFSWDTTFSFGLNRADQRRKNSFNSAKLQQALGPAFIDDSGALRCGTAAMPGDPNCVPFNLFGGQGVNGQGTITAEMLRYVTYTQHDVSEQRLIDWVTNVGGKLAQLPGGPLSVGIGIEHRRLQGFFEPDSVVSAGDSADVPAQPTSGSYWVNEAYAELRAPLIADVPGIALLDLNAAGRVSDYSFLKPELTGKVGGRYKPRHDVVLRASYGRGFRAPSIGELFGSASRFDAQLSDPCSDFNRAGTTEATRQRCIELGVPADGSYTQLNPQISVTTGGNPKLEPERSRTINVSIAYSPQELQDQPKTDRFDIELAYWDIHLDGAITAPNAQYLLDRCVSSDNGVCAGIGRTPQGQINSFNNRLLNIGGIDTRGFDLALTYRTKMLPFGRLGARWLSSYMLDFWERIPSAQGTQTVKMEGKLIAPPERAFPQLKSNLVLEWTYKQLAVALTTRYIHGVTEACRDLGDYPDTCSDPDADDDTRSTNWLAPSVYNDLRIVWMPEFDERLTITAGVNNLLNVAPPVCYSCTLNGFNAATYDVPGVFGYLSAGYQMR